MEKVEFKKGSSGGGCSALVPGAVTYRLIRELPKNLVVAGNS